MVRSRRGTADAGVYPLGQLRETSRYRSLEGGEACRERRWRRGGGWRGTGGNRGRFNMGSLHMSRGRCCPLCRGPISAQKCEENRGCLREIRRKRKPNNKEGGGEGEKKKLGNGDGELSRKCALMCRAQDDRHGWCRPFRGRNVLLFFFLLSPASPSLSSPSPVDHPDKGK